MMALMDNYNLTCLTLSLNLSLSLALQALNVLRVWLDIFYEWSILVDLKSTALSGIQTQIVRIRGDHETTATGSINVKRN